jgi:hypothetical protein
MDGKCRRLWLFFVMFLVFSIAFLANLRITLKVEFNDAGNHGFEVPLDFESAALKENLSREGQVRGGVVSVDEDKSVTAPALVSQSIAQATSVPLPTNPVVSDARSEVTPESTSVATPAVKVVFPKRPIKDITINTSLPTIKLVLLRAIGNALPPRHDPEQAYQNLKFTLENELEFPHLQKQWVMNRLVDQDLLNRLASLLESHGQKYTIIPFNLTEYDKVSYRFDYYSPGKEKDVVHSAKYVLNQIKGQYQIDEAINHDKNLFVTNQNAARNVMIDMGQKYYEVDWVLPWDGNSFLHPSAYQDIYQSLQAMPTNHKYAYTPMNRAMENYEVLNETYTPNPIEEPQVIFHKRAKGRYHEKLRYGRRNKVEFIQRLGVKGPWDKWSPYLPWEKKNLGPFLEPIPDLQKDEDTKAVGWVTRLTSGRQHLEVKGTIHARGQSRLASMILLLGNLDAKAAIELHRYRPKQLIFYHEESLARDRELYLKGDAKVKPVIEELIQHAQNALTAGPWSVTDKPDDSVAISGDKHDYYHLSPYYWPKSPEEAKDPNIKWVRKDGERYPGTELNEPGSEKFDRTRVKNLHYNTTILGLAYFMTGEKQYAEVAARNVRTWFLDAKTRMNPHMQFAQVRGGYDNNIGISFGIIEMKDLYFMLDAVRLVERDGFITEDEQIELRVWFAQYLEWLETSKIGQEEYAQSNNHGLYFDVQASAIAAYLNDVPKMIMYIEKATQRLLAHVVGNGSMPGELRRPTCEHYQIFTLQGWAVLSRLAQVVNRNIWKFESNKGATALCRAAKYSIPFYGREAKCKSKKIQEENVERWWPLLQDSRYHCPELSSEALRWPTWFPGSARVPPSSAYSMPILYDAHDGIAPFWNLGLVHGNKTWSNSIVKR